MPEASIAASVPTASYDLVLQYLSQLTPLERKALLIAESHLGTSFDILRSTGYVTWLKKQKA